MIRHCVENSTKASFVFGSIIRNAARCEAQIGVFFVSETRKESQAAGNERHNDT